MDIIMDIIIMYIIKDIMVINMDDIIMNYDMDIKTGRAQPLIFS